MLASHMRTAFSAIPYRTIDTPTVVYAMANTGHGEWPRRSCGSSTQVMGFGVQAPGRAPAVLLGHPQVQEELADDVGGAVR